MSAERTAPINTFHLATLDIGTTRGEKFLCLVWEDADSLWTANVRLRTVLVLLIQPVEIRAALKTVVRSVDCAGHLIHWTHRYWKVWIRLTELDRALCWSSTASHFWLTERVKFAGRL